MEIKGRWIDNENNWEPYKTASVLMDKDMMLISDNLFWHTQQGMTTRHPGTTMISIPLDLLPTDPVK